MNTSEVPENLRPYIPLLMELILVSPVNRNGKLVPYTDIVNELESDTIQISSGVGVVGGSRFSCGIFSQGANLTLQVKLIFHLNYFQFSINNNIHRLNYQNMQKECNGLRNYCTIQNLQ